MSAPQEKSSLSDEVPSMPVDVRQYRLLDEQNRPYLATFLFSNPHEAFFLDIEEQTQLDPARYELVSSAIGVDGQNQVRFRERSESTRLTEIAGHEGSIFEMPPEQLFLEVPYDSATTNQKFTVELRSNRPDTAEQQEGIFQGQIRGLGEMRTGEQPKLSTDEEQLQMGDLILGIRRSAADAALPFGFRVQPATTIPHGENLIVHFEVYHLSGTEDEINPFQLEYVVNSGDTGLLNRLFGKGKKVQLQLNFEATGTHFRENLEIETSPFEPGTYTLHLTAREPETEREVSREIDFTVEETDDE